MILGLLTLPFRLLGLVILAGLVYLGWTYRTELRRFVHRATADSVEEPPAPARPVDRAAARVRATARLDSLAKHRADSVVLAADELEGLIAEPLRQRAGGAVDDLTIELGDGELGLRGRVDPNQLPRGTLGPLAQWITGRETVEARGPFALRRLGVGEWRITEVEVHGVPLPRAVWSRLLPPEGTAGGGTLSLPLESWVTGVRVTPGGVILYGRADR